MHQIRAVELEIASRYREGKMRTPTHLSIGQESVAVGTCLALPYGSQVFSNHRCHAHYLAQGGNVDRMIAELYGKKDGCAGGWGGSMHLVDESVGFMGTSAIVGSCVPVAVGAAIAIKNSRKSGISCAFMGDAGIETGQVYESVHLAGLWSLPILFVMEDNGLATQTPIEVRQRNPENWHVIAEALGVTAFDIGHEVEKVYETTQLALEQLPAFIRIKTDRWYTHVGPELDDELGLTEHREDGYKSRYHERDEVEKLLERLSEEDRFLIEWKNQERAKLAFEFAELSEWPKTNGI
jgi:TPP-dependent pyruvate/acetoin dehydrogenase alpha subunit